MRRLLNSTSLHFILSFVVVILTVIVLILAVVEYAGEEQVMVEVLPFEEECLPGRNC